MTETLPRVVIDKTRNNTKTGEEYERTLVVKIASYGTGDQRNRACFSFDPETRTYRLEEYESVKRQMGVWKSAVTRIEPKDFDILRFMATHIEERTEQPVDVLPFEGVVDE